MAEPSPLAVAALALGLFAGCALMQGLINAGLAVPGYSSDPRERRAVGWGATVGVAFAAFTTSAASAVVPGALAVLPVAFAALIAGLALVLIPNVLRSH